MSYNPGHQCDLCGNQWTTVIRRPELEASGIVAHLCAPHVRQYLAWGQFMVMIGLIHEYPGLTKDERAKWPQNKATTVKMTRS